MSDDLAACRRLARGWLKYKNTASREKERKQKLHGHFQYWAENVFRTGCARDSWTNGSLKIRPLVVVGIHRWRCWPPFCPRSQEEAEKNVGLYLPGRYERDVNEETARSAGERINRWARMLRSDWRNNTSRRRRQATKNGGPFPILDANFFLFLLLSRGFLSRSRKMFTRPAEKVFRQSRCLSET